MACVGPDGESKLLKGSDCSTDLLQALQCEEVVLNHNELTHSKHGIIYFKSCILWVISSLEKLFCVCISMSTGRMAGSVLYRIWRTKVVTYTSVPCFFVDFWSIYSNLLLLIILIIIIIILHWRAFIQWFYGLTVQGIEVHMF